MSITTDQIQPGKVFCGKRGPNRKVISVGRIPKLHLMAYVEFEPTNLKPGAKYPRCSAAEFLAWAESEVENGGSEKN